MSSSRTPLFEAQNSERYARQQIIRQYQEALSVNLIVMIDQIFPDNMTYLEELLFQCDSSKPIHLLLASPGGDGETAIRLVRSIHSRCSDLTVLLPDMAKSAATLMCLGADHLLFGPGGDLGPVDPQMRLGQGALVSAKEIVEAVDEAERRITSKPDTFPLFSSLLADVNMIMVEQARSAIDRSGALVREALLANPRRNADAVDELAGKLNAPLIEEPTSHSAVIPCGAAQGFGLPAMIADPSSSQWRLIWSLWTRYFFLGCFPAGTVAVYEGERASLVMSPEGQS